jgi:PAS domain S-box-containing protein
MTKAVRRGLLKQDREIEDKVAIAVLDLKGRFVITNVYAPEILGYSREELIGRECSFLLAPKDRRRMKEYCKGVLQRGRRPFRFELELPGEPNGRRVVALEIVPIRHDTSSLGNADGSAIAIAIVRKVTPPKRVEDRLSATEERYRVLQDRFVRREQGSSLVENLPDIISRLDRNLRFLYVSPNVKTLFGIPAADFLGKRPRGIGVRSHDWLGFEKACRQAFTSGKAVQREFTWANRYYRARIVPEPGPAGKPESILCIDQDITEQKRIEGELRMLSSRLLDLQDVERRRIAREMHDGTAQNLFAVNIALTRLLRQTTAPEFRATLEECMSLCEQSREEIRTLSYVLHPPMLDRAGLASALKWYLEGFSSRTGIDVDLFVSRKLRRLPAEIETDLFRVAQEALTNIHLHSGSRIATVKLVRGPGRVMLQIRDWGRGIPPGIAQAGRPGFIGVGILGMRERLAQLNGTLDVDSSREGTTITAIVPLINTRAQVLTTGASGQKQA